MIPRDPENLSRFIIETPLQELSGRLSEATIQHTFFKAIKECKLEIGGDLAEKISNVVHTQNLNKTEQKALFAFIKVLRGTQKKDVLNRLLQDAVLNCASWDFIEKILSQRTDHGQIHCSNELKAYLNSKDPVHGETPLVQAMVNREIGRAQLLLELGANPNALNRRGDPVIYNAIANTNMDKAWYEVIKLLLNKGANPNARINELSLLHRAVGVDDVELVRILLDYDADPNIEDDKKNTPLFYAVEINNLEIAEILLKDKRTIINFVDEIYTTPLYLALIEDKEEMAKLLEKYGASINVIDKAGFVPFCYEYFRNRADVISRMLAHGADQRLAKEILDRKALAQIHAIDGSTEIKVRGETKRIDLGPFFALTSIKIAYDYFEKFINKKEQEHAPQNLLKSLEKLLESLSNYSNAREELYQRINQGLPAIIHSGWGGHGIKVVIYKGNVVVCNAGEGRDETEEGNVRTGVVYKLGELKEDELRRLIEFLDTEYLSQKEFNDGFSKFNLVRRNTPEDDVSIMQKGQKVGNCAWASIKTAILALLILEFGEIEGRKLFKEFGVLAKEYSFTDYITEHHVQGHIDPLTDYDLILQIHEKKLTKQMREAKLLIKDFRDNKTSKTSEEMTQKLINLKMLYEEIIKLANDCKQKGYFSLSVYGDHSLRISDIGKTLTTLTQELTQATLDKKKR